MEEKILRNEGQWRLELNAHSREVTCIKENHSEVSASMGTVGYLNNLGISSSNAPGVGNFLLCFSRTWDEAITDIISTSKNVPEREIWDKWYKNKLVTHLF